MEGRRFRLRIRVQVEDAGSAFAKAMADHHRTLREGGLAGVIGRRRTADAEPLSSTRWWPTALVLALLAAIALPRVGGAQVLSGTAPPSGTTSTSPTLPTRDAATISLPGQAVGLETVSIDASISDRRGRPLLSLTAADIELEDDGALQPVTLTLRNAGRITGSTRRSEVDVKTGPEPAAGPRVVSLYLDEYHVDSSDTPRVREAVKRFVQEQLRPDDLVTVFRPLDPVRPTASALDRAALFEAIEAFTGRKGDYVPRSPFEQNYLSRTPPAADASRAQVVLSGVQALAAQVGAQHPGRKIIVLVSDGFLTDPPRARDPVPGSIDGILRAANRFNVAIHAICPRTCAGREDEGPSVAMSGRRGLLLERVTRETGGELHQGDTDVDAALAATSRHVNTYYLLSYPSPHVRDGRFHAIALRVKRPAGAIVQVRSGYWSPLAADLTSPAAGPLASRRTNTAPLRQSPLIRPWFGMARGANGLTRVTLTWEPAPMKGDRTADGVTVKVMREDGAVLFDGAVAPVGPPGLRGAGPPERATFNAPPGRVEVQMTIVDSDVRNLRVPDFNESRTALGTPEIFRSRTAREFRVLATDPAASPVTSREFSRTERLLVRVLAYPDGSERPVITARLLNAVGHAIRTLMTVDGLDDPDITQIDLPLAPLAPGDYRIELTARGPLGQTTDFILIRVVS
jgi:VWFA-related protein